MGPRRDGRYLGGGMAAHGGLGDEGWGRLAEVIVEVGRELRRHVPPPREAPYYCLDFAGRFDPGVFDVLARRDIFRKYEFALDIGGGLGGRARWLALRHGCRVVGVDACQAKVEAAAMLNRRAHLGGRVRFQPGTADALPFRSRVFTHVWMLDVAPCAVGAAPLREAFRVLRSGGHFAMQAYVVGAFEGASVLECVRAAGFTELEAVEVRLRDASDTCRWASQRLRAALGKEPELASLWDAGHSNSVAMSALQVFGRRPS